MGGRKTATRPPSQSPPLGDIMKLYRLSDRITVDINGVKVQLSPLTFAQKTEIQQHMFKAAKGDVVASLDGAKLAVAYSLKAIDGVEDMAGNKYELRHENGTVTQECLEELFNSEMAGQLVTVCVSLLASIPKEFIDPNTGRPLEGVSIVNPKVAAP